MNRLAHLSLSALGAVALALGPAAVAFGNAANPTEAKALIWDCGASNAPVDCSSGAVVEVYGQWSWGELADQKSSPQQDCAGRYGVGWSVDWWGMSSSQDATPIAGLRGSTVTAATKSNPPADSWDTLTPDGAWAVKGTDLFFHTSEPFNGFVADLCNNASQTPTGPEGSFKSYAVYPSRDAIPPRLCVNFYDPHGKRGQWSTADGDNSATKDGDNSIKTNDFNPSTVSGYCLAPQNAAPPKAPAAPRLVVSKDGPASGRAGGTGTYAITLTNKGDATANGPTSFVDILPTGESFVSVDSAASDTGMTCQANQSDPQRLDCTYDGDIAAGSARTVAVTVQYAPDTAGDSLTDCAGLMPAGAKACVTTSIPKPEALDLAIVKTASESSATTGDTLTYTLQVTNDSDQPTTGTVTVTDTLPDGLAIAGPPAGDGWTCDTAGAAVTCTLAQGPLGPGEAASPITVPTTVLASAPSTLVNTGVVATPGDVNPANDRSTVRTPVAEAPTVLGKKIVKTPPQAAPAPQALPAPQSSPHSPTASALPFTGWNASTWTLIGLALLGAGFRLLQLARRRRNA